VESPTLLRAMSGYFNHNPASVTYEKTSFTGNSWCCKVIRPATQSSPLLQTVIKWSTWFARGRFLTKNGLALREQDQDGCGCSMKANEPSRFASLMWISCPGGQRNAFGCHGVSAGNTAWLLLDEPPVFGLAQIELMDYFKILKPTYKAYHSGRINMT